MAPKTIAIVVTICHATALARAPALYRRVADLVVNYRQCIKRLG